MSKLQAVPLDQTGGRDLVTRRHHEWNEWQRTWRFLADSWEGGNRYRSADYTISPTAVVADGASYAPWYTYGFDPLTSQPYTVAYGQIVDRNLFPHLNETGNEGRDLYVQRLARTPVPALIETTVESHLTRIYAREVTRKSTDAATQKTLDAWWKDCDGRGTSIEDFMSETVAPLLTVLGQLDLCFDHPEAPEGTMVSTKADLKATGLDRCVASIILPENMVWWRLDANRAAYAEALVFERYSGGVCYRHWTDRSSFCYDTEGKYIADRSRLHPFGRVPIFRAFDRRLPRCENIGKSRYMSIAQLQRAVYNATSELILSDVQQSHAQLQGPAEYLQANSKIPIGPDKILPMKPLLNSSGTVSGYQGWGFVDPPKGAQEALRTHIQDFKDDADRSGALCKPAGQVQGKTVAQSGVSKIADQVDGNALLARLAKTLGKCENGMAGFALTVISDGTVDPTDFDTITVAYPSQFDLYTLDDLASALTCLQTGASLAGALPETEGELLKRIIAITLPGIDEARLTELHDEVTAFMARASAESEQEADHRDDSESTNDTNTERALNGQDIVAGPNAVLISPQPS
jgi:hypothetical protein